MFKRISIVFILVIFSSLLAALPGYAQESDCESGINYLAQGRARKAAGDLQGAQQSFNCGLQFEQNKAHLFFERGTTHCLLRDADKAAADYMSAIRADPFYVMAYNNYGWANYLLGNYDEALWALDRAISFDPELSFAYNNRGLVYQSLGLVDRAIQEYEKAIELDIPYPWATVNLYNARFEKAKLLLQQERA